MNNSVQQGDLVIRKSYSGDITFRIESIFQQMAIIKGIDFRLVADSPVNDLVSVSATIIKRREQQTHIKMLESVKVIELHCRKQYERRQPQTANSTSSFELPGTVLHLDGDPRYLQKSMSIYNRLRVPAEGHYVNELNMADMLYYLLPRIKPSIVVITGHDGLLKTGKQQDLSNLKNYKNSQHFVKSVQTARKFERHLDLLTVIAGACQSHFEALLQAGANFASSPGRIMIHAFDPVYVAVKAAYTSVRDTIQIGELASHMVTGINGVGGVETRGSHRVGMPKLNNVANVNVTSTIV